MLDQETKTSTDLILKGRIAGIPIAVRGTLENGEFGGLSGCVPIEKPLEALITDLGPDFDKAAEMLNQLSGGQFGNIVLDSLAFGYRNIAPKFTQIVVTMTAGGNTYRFVMLKMAENGGFVVGLDLQWDKTLFRNNILSGLVGDISIGDLGIYFASEPLLNVRFDPAQDFQDIKDITMNIPEVKGRDFAKGLNLSAQIFIGGVNLLDWSGLKDAENAAPKVQEKAATVRAARKTEKTQLAPVSTIWIKIDKSLGPLSIRRIGLSYEAPQVGIKFDASVQLSCLTLSLLGFGLSYPLNKISTKPEQIIKQLEFRLDGAALALDAGPLSIGGGLLKSNDNPLQLDGTLMVRVQTFAISALGSYADLKGKPSLFVFAALHQPLGGPPYFFVTGLAFGFGVNRALIIPAITEVHNFPLVRSAVDPAYLGKKLDLREISIKIGDYIYPSAGDFWMAAGLKFTSFGMINSFAMITVSFGTQFQIALLGLARITVPVQVPGAPEVEPIACAELALKVSLTLATGVLAVEAGLTDNSFILSRKCRLTGGFAFYCWFGPEHEGDFVVTLGGYHPRFIPPQHYPLVPRLGMNWPVSSNLSVTGGIYFALTPSCCMAGGKLNAVYDAGNLRAWFCAYADFLINWKPFYYDIAIGVSIGVSYRITLLGINKTFAIELGASVRLWGPPFGGVAHISWWVISFDFNFGKLRSQTPLYVSWDEFHQSFLPQQQNSQATEAAPDPVVSSIRIAGGLIRELEKEGKEGEKVTLRVVNAHGFSFTTESLIPSTSVRLNDNPVDIIPDAAKAKLGIRPMGIPHLQSEHSVSVEKKLNPAAGWDACFNPSPIKKSVPYALWSKDLSRLDRPSAEKINDIPSGIQVSLKAGAPSHELNPIDLEKFKYDKIPKRIPWKEFKIPDQIPAPGKNTLMNTIWDNSDVNKKRNAILQSLGMEGLQLQAVEVPDLAANAKEIFHCEPEMAVLGEEFKRPLD